MMKTAAKIGNMKRITGMFAIILIASITIVQASTPAIHLNTSDAGSYFELPDSEIENRMLDLSTWELESNIAEEAEEEMHHALFQSVACILSSRLFRY
ncbi:hypothetical protein ES705_41241 [subsurface metagenome]